MFYRNYKLDPFQEKAFEAIKRGESLLVAAPTGCGKTLIAEYAIEVSLTLGKKAIYTAPVKALSNQKFRDFRSRFGEKNVGIQTGDVTINPDAPLLIMTTEIFRNLILEGSERIFNIYYVVFDEIHYLDDPERGTVWEESIILAPSQIRFMCLSATVPNVKELAMWMETVRGTRFTVIEETKRTVPLKHIFYSPKFGIMNIKSIRRKFIKNPQLRKKFLRKKPSSKKIVRLLLEERNIPALYFCFNRKACEYNAELHSFNNLLSKGERERVIKMVDELVESYNLGQYERLQHLRMLWENGTAYHHAGMLPSVKEIVERLFTEGLIKLLFCTETFALGINMPAKAVVFDELEKFDGVDFKYLLTREYNQMAGRAGRRGIDEIGYVYSQIIPEATDPEHLERLMYGNNERINSRFSASYSTILNLYSKFGDEAFEIFKKSFHNFKKGEFSISKAYKKEEEQIRRRIKFLQTNGFINGRNLTKKGELAASISGYEIQVAEIYYSRTFEDYSASQIPVILAALITEENRVRKKSIPSSLTLKFEAEKIIHKLRQKEIKHGIIHPIREMNFSYAAPIYAWANGCSLQELLAFGVPEGDIIRILRMTIQLLRTLRDKIPDEYIADRLHESILLINRDVVDAQAQLEVG